MTFLNFILCIIILILLAITLIQKITVSLYKKLYKIEKEYAEDLFKRFTNYLNKEIKK
jgi:hypothetical protein